MDIEASQQVCDCWGLWPVHATGLSLTGADILMVYLCV